MPLPPNARLKSNVWKISPFLIILGVSMISYSSTPIRSLHNWLNLSWISRQFPSHPCNNAIGGYITTFFILFSVQNVSNKLYDRGRSGPATPVFHSVKWLFSSKQSGGFEGKHRWILTASVPPAGKSHIYSNLCVHRAIKVTRPKSHSSHRLCNLVSSVM